MAETAESLNQQLDALRKARATGAKVVRYSSGGDSREVEYRSDREIATAIADLERRIALLSGRAPVRVVYINSSKGV